MRIAIVNDLALAREVLRRLVHGAPGLEVAWLAENGAEAVLKAAQDRPDAILMDLVMPVLDGVEATRRIMSASPCPILLVTSSVTGNFNLVYAAMGHGALDAVNTPSLGPGNEVRGGEGILARLAKLAQAKQLAGRPGDWPEPWHGLPAHAGTGWKPVPQPRLSVVALGASTGGPEAVGQILSVLPANFAAAVIVVQHIAAEYVPGLATWLQTRCKLPIRLARQQDELQPGVVLLAASDDHLLLRPDRRLAYTPEPASFPYRPSVDVFFESLARHWPHPGVAALLTGMGYDGARGLLSLKQAGWHTIAQAESSCVVYGMPKAAVELRAPLQTLPLPQIGAAIVERLTGKK